jgi:hypothetical protein
MRRHGGSGAEFGAAIKLSRRAWLAGAARVRSHVRMTTEPCQESRLKASTIVAAI